ncbi:unnamed protein product [Arctia plantaginis]|uniref:Uncharacterized protein n=1 Tax=Arctia plantaginis TaxID=874455 RepID=A0A8S0ZQW2_ARCPL|nr:unnamed protein product [Arctia plantaginis]
MGHFSFAFFCIFLSIVNSEDYGWKRANINGIVSDMEGNIFPVQGYINGQGNYAGLEQRSVPSISCFKHGAPQDVQLEQPEPSPSRRSFTFISERNFESTSQPFLKYENNQFSRTESKEPWPPQLNNSEDNLPENQVSLHETSPTPNENLINDDIIEITQPIPETTTPVIEMQMNQEIVPTELELEERKKSKFGVDPKMQFRSQSPVSTETPNFLTECADKSKFDSFNKPPRRFLGKLTNDVPSQKKILEKNNGQQTHSFKAVQLPQNNGNDVINENGTVYKFNVYKSQNSEKSLQQPTENMIGQAGSIRYTYNNNIYTKVKDPAKGKDITYINKNTRINLLDIDRVCYACSTENNPTCWLPDRRTTVKYCRKSDNACVTKTFGSESKFLQIYYQI